MQRFCFELSLIIRTGTLLKNICPGRKNAMKYKLELITEAPKLEPLIAETEDKIFILTNDRDDRTIQSNRGQKALGRRSKAIASAEAKRDTAVPIAAGLPDGDLKNKQLSVVQTQNAILFKLNLPAAANASEDVVDVELDKGERDALIVYWEDVLTNLNARKKQLLGG